MHYKIPAAPIVAIFLSMLAMFGGIIFLIIFLIFSLCH